MKNLIGILMLALILGSCDSISKYRIDDQPCIKIDTGLLGIWKAVEDTEKADYILVQNTFDAFHKTDSNLLLTDKNKEYLKIKQERDKHENYNFYITRFDHQGKNPKYQQFVSVLSEVNKVKYLNVRYHNTLYDGKNFMDITDEEMKTLNNKSKTEIWGYFFVRFIKINKDYDSITLAVFKDPSLKNVSSSSEVRKHIQKYQFSPSHYYDTLHFYKVSSYHLDAKVSILKANSK